MREDDDGKGKKVARRVLLDYLYDGLRPCSVAG